MEKKCADDSGKGGERVMAHHKNTVIKPVGELIHDLVHVPLPSLPYIPSAKDLKRDHNLRSRPIVSAQPWFLPELAFDHPPPLNEGRNDYATYGVLGLALAARTNYA